MPSNDMNAQNASGLTPNETKSLKERIPEHHEEKIIQGIKEETYKIYTSDATFHDPVGIAEGIKAIRAQFNGLVKVFPRADLEQFRLLENPPSVPKGTILIDQDVSYYRDPSGSPTKVHRASSFVGRRHALTRFISKTHKDGQLVAHLADK
ncbi:predicted protein [Postia placenta Mad-698-R]|nr:predicted protein [Postia placenta Mad-698-R]